MSDWRVHIDDSQWQRDVYRLAIHRRWGDHEHIVRGDGTITTVEQGLTIDPDTLIAIPRDALEPLRDAIDKLLGVRVDKATLNEVRAALEVERGRVDRVLAVLPTPAAGDRQPTPQEGQ